MTPHSGRLECGLLLFLPSILQAIDSILTLAVSIVAFPIDDQLRVASRSLDRALRLLGGGDRILVRVMCLRWLMGGNNAATGPSSQSDLAPELQAKPASAEGYEENCHGGRVGIYS